MDIAGFILVGFSLVSFIFLVVTWLDCEFEFGILVSLGCFLFLSVLSFAVWDNSKTDNVYSSYKVESVGDNFRVSKKECLEYTLGTDECKIVEEMFVDKKALFNSVN